MHSEAQAYRLHMHTMFQAYQQLVTFLAGSPYTIFWAYKELVTFLAGSPYTIFWAYKELVTFLAGSPYTIFWAYKELMTILAGSSYTTATTLAGLYYTMFWVYKELVIILAGSSHLVVVFGKDEHVANCFFVEAAVFFVVLQCQTIHPAFLVKVQQHLQPKQHRMVSQPTGIPTYYNTFSLKLHT